MDNEPIRLRVVLDIEVEHAEDEDDAVFAAEEATWEALQVPFSPRITILDVHDVLTEGEL